MAVAVAVAVAAVTAAIVPHPAMAAAVTSVRWYQSSILRFYVPLIAIVVLSNIEQAPHGLVYLGLSRFVPAVSLLQSFLKENTQGFLVLLGVAVYFEFASSPRHVGLTSEALQLIDDRIRTPALGVPARERLKEYLSNVYGCKNVDNLVNIVCSDKILNDVDVDLRICDDPSDVACINYSNRTSFRADIDELVVAFAPDALTQDYIASFPQVQFSRSISRSVLTEEFAELYAKSISIHLSDGSTEADATLNRIPQKRIGNYVPGLKDAALSSIYLFNAQFSQKNYRRIGIEFPPIKIKKDAHYVYWSADFPMFVRRISVDVSDFKSFPRHRFNLQSSILALRLKQHHYRETGQACIQVDDWVTYGQGVTFSWR